MNNFKIFFVLILFSQLSLAQDRIVSGVVNDSTGVPLPGVQILIEGTQKSAQTNFDGHYSIKVNSDQFLVFSYIGMNRQRISASKNEIDVILQIDHSTMLSDLIPPNPVSRNKKKESLYYAIKTISAEDIKNASDPKYNFKQDYNNSPLIFVSDYTLKKTDYEFEIKYKIRYSPIRDYNIEYVKAYNNLTFKYLKRKYKKTWQSEIRKDAIGLNDFLKKN
jgi:hypothetical protein